MIRIGPRAKLILSLVAAALVIVLVLAATIPASWFKGLAERQLSERFGRPVTIASMERESAVSFAPVVRIAGLSIPQAAWAGPGKLASVGLLRVRIAVLPALIGRIDPQVLGAQDVKLDFVRDAQRRVNWRKDGEKPQRGGGGGLSLGELGQVQAEVRYRDAFQHRAFRLDVTIDPKTGLTANGEGAIEGNPVTLAAQGPVGQPDKPWPFTASIVGPAITMRLKGTMAAPLRMSDMRLAVTARANDLKLIDRVIEAGLFGTQPVDVRANVQHQDRRWTITDLAGTIGANSRLTGKLTVDKQDGRTKLDGEIRFAQLDFEDLATDAGNAAARALEQAEGKKLVPNTRINIRKIDKTDGRIAFRIDRIVSPRPSALRSARGVLTIDHRLLIAKPFELALSRGTIGGEVRVDQRQGQAEPTVTLTLDLRGSSIDALAGGAGEVDAPVDGQVRLAGVGSTVRAAVGNADGTIGVIAHDGALPAKLANLLGFDLGKSLFASGDEQATLRCAAVRLELRRGIGRAAPVVVDTSEGQTRGVGTITFPEERIALTLTGAPKRNSVLRLPGSATALGTIREPTVIIPREVKSVGNVLKALGRAITGKQGPEAPDADCAQLSRRIIGG